MTQHGVKLSSRTLPVRRRLWLLVPVLAIGVIIALTVPWNTGTLDSRPAPITTYAQAVQRVDSLQAAQESSLIPECVIKLMTHGRRADDVIVLVHGYTSCPQQFVDLGKQFFDQGYNVLITPLPHHGLRDRMNTEQSLLTAEELVAYADDILDLAGGLGERITVGGISGGGVVAAWAAQHRRDVDLAVVISPAFGFQQVPTPLTGASTNAFRLLPNSYAWWDPELQDRGGIPHAYPRYSTRALAEFMRLGFAVRGAARRQPPAAGQILIITNGAEPSVNNELTQQLAGLWIKRAAVSLYEFPASLNLPHDLIDPLQPDQNTRAVYPVLVDLVAQARGIASP